MNEEELLAARVRSAGFYCRSCSACCSGPENEVMVSPSEIQALSAASGIPAEEISEPYPEWIDDPAGGRCTFGWVIRRGEDGNCIFLEDGRCRVYASRPHLCRTYPFMLNGDRLIISECPGRCACEETADADGIVHDLILRRDAEDAEYLQTEQQYQKHSIKAGSTIVFDSTGAHTYSPTPRRS